MDSSLVSEGVVVRRAILQAIFAGLYFDAQNELRKVAAHDPFFCNGFVIRHFFRFSDELRKRCQGITRISISNSSFGGV